MNCLNALSLVPVVLVALSSPAVAQEVASANEAPHAYAMGVGGAAFNQNFENATASVAFEYGERVSRNVTAYANFSFIDNLMSDPMRQNLDSASSMLGQEFSGRDRGLAFTMGGKYLLPTGRRVRPYFGGGFGLINLKRYISEQTFGDVTNTFFFMTGLNDGVIDAGESATTKPLGELIAGVSAAMNNRTYVDVKYRYGRVFNSVENIDFSQVSFGIGVTF
jgi:opacity protein-like surface antigen